MENENAVQNQVVWLVKKIYLETSETLAFPKIRLTKKGYVKGVRNCWWYTLEGVVKGMERKEIIKILDDKERPLVAPTSLVPVFYCTFNRKRAINFLIEVGALPASPKNRPFIREREIHFQGKSVSFTGKRNKRQSGIIKKLVDVFPAQIGEGELYNYASLATDSIGESTRRNQIHEIISNTSKEINKKFRIGSLPLKITCKGGRVRLSPQD